MPTMAYITSPSPLPLLPLYWVVMVITLLICPSLRVYESPNVYWVVLDWLKSEYGYCVVTSSGDGKRCVWTLSK